MSVHKIDTVIIDVQEEVERAGRLHPPMNSIHEGYAVMLEEVDEFWDEAKRKTPDREHLRHELVQVAAMAVRIIIDCLEER